MGVATGNVPVTMGSPVFRTLDADAFAVVEAWFPAGEVLPRHTHERPSFAIMLGGSFELQLTTRAHDCPPTAVFTEPAGEPHANLMGPRGAHVVVVQPDPARTDLYRPFGRILERPAHIHHAGIAERAARLASELDRPDDLSLLSAEGAVLEMFVTMARLGGWRERRPPPWLLRAQELLHARFTEPLRLADVAREVEVHPAHLARAFRAHFRMSMGPYVRRLRLDWAAGELGRSDLPLAAVALTAGFADQSHFTRAFKRYLGVTPNVYRRTRGR